jgi:hypothetical protein
MIACPKLPSVSRFHESSAERALTLLSDAVDNNDIVAARAHFDALRPSFCTLDTSRAACAIVGHSVLWRMQRRRSPGDVARLLEFIDIVPACLSYRDEDGMNALHYYCMVHRLPFDVESRLLDVLLDHDGALAWCVRFPPLFNYYFVDLVVQPPPPTSLFFFAAPTAAPPTCTGRPRCTRWWARDGRRWTSFVR